MQVDKLEYDGNLSIAIGLNVSSKIWKNTKMTWSNLVQKLSTPVITAETYKRFMNATKEEQSKIKDVGGFVGGFLTNGRRDKTNVLYRQLITLDIDFSHENFWWTCATGIWRAATGSGCIRLRISYRHSASGFRAWAGTSPRRTLSG